jgi:hypothetical protein
MTLAATLEDAGLRPGDQRSYAAAVIGGILALTLFGALAPVTTRTVTIMDLVASAGLGFTLLWIPLTMAIMFVGIAVGYQVGHRLTFGRWPWPFAPRAPRRKPRRRVALVVATVGAYLVTSIGIRVAPRDWVPDMQMLYEVPGEGTWVEVLAPGAMALPFIAGLGLGSIVYLAAILAVGIVMPSSPVEVS